MAGSVWGSGLNNLEKRSTQHHFSKIFTVNATLRQKGQRHFWTWTWNFKLSLEKLLPSVQIYIGREVSSCGRRVWPLMTLAYSKKSSHIFIFKSLDLHEQNENGITTQLARPTTKKQPKINGQTQSKAISNVMFSINNTEQNNLYAEFTITRYLIIKKIKQKMVHILA